MYVYICMYVHTYNYVYSYKPCSVKRGLNASAKGIDSSQPAQSVQPMFHMSKEYTSSGFKWLLHEMDFF